MANLDNELFLDAQEDKEIISFIRQQLPQELKDRFSDEQLYYFLDVIEEYYAESGILDSPPDKDGYIEVDQERVANFLAKTAKKEGLGDFNPEDLLFVVEAEWDFNLQDE
ncbi:MAG: hypothetical protein IJ816_01985 [Alloprevotella sp.]|nr:hypothetical protein [Alloprevotella sp.]